MKMAIIQRNDTFSNVCNFPQGLTQLQELNVSWNKLTNTREELSILRKHFSTLRFLEVHNNPWLKASCLFIDFLK